MMLLRSRRRQNARGDALAVKRSRIPLLTALLLVIGFAGTTTCHAAENVWSVESFNSRKPEWDQLLGAAIRVEGRLSLSGGGQLRLSKCEVPFHAAEALVKSVQGKKAVEITGRLKKENGKLSFEVDRIQVVPTDLELFESRSPKGRNPKPADWYELGDWAAERSRFYDDAELAKKSQSAYDRGIKAEWQAMDADDAAARFELADKVALYKLPDQRRMELKHEGDRILWHQTLKNKEATKETWTKLTAKLAEDLPGSTQALAAFPTDLKERYEREPLPVYREAADDVRRQLHRIFFTTVLLKTILDDADKNGSNGDVIAEQLDRRVPEAKSLADQYRALKLAWRLGQAATATRPEIELLAADFRARQQPEQARLALTKWLRAQEVRYRRDGPLGLLQLADEHLALLQDESKAVAILVEANKIDPAFTDVSDKLKSLGYANIGGTWAKSNGATPLTAGMSDLTLPGPIAVGMDAIAARRAMGSRPGSLARALTKRGASEVWSYGQAGSRLIIRLEATGPTRDLRVVDIKSEQ